MTRTLLVISDLHIGAGPLDDCDNELESHLVTFLRRCASRQGPTELIINGDFLDFVQAPPWEGSDLESETEDEIRLCFTLQQSTAKLCSILNAHLPIFHALREFLAVKSDNQVTILPGNHDVDFFWHEVRSLFCKTVCGTDVNLFSQIRFHLDQVYRPTSYSHVWIEHGHQYDPCNSFFVKEAAFWSEKSPPILHDESGVPRLIECIGTRFLIRFLNSLDADYPFVDNVKPFSRFLRSFALSALKPPFGPFKVLSQMWSGLGFVSQTLFSRPTDLLQAREDAGTKPYLPFVEWAKHLTHENASELVSAMKQRGFRIEVPLDMFLSDEEGPARFMDFLSKNSDLSVDLSEEEDHSLLGDEPGTLALGNEFNINETERLKLFAKAAFRDLEIQTVVMGHTHEVVKPTADLNYVNSGCWTRYYRFDIDDELPTWSMLRTNSYALFPYQLNVVEISQGQAAVRLTPFMERSDG